MFFPLAFMYVCTLFLISTESHSISKKSADCQCGLTKSRGLALRVVGGRYLDEDEHPFLALLLHYQSFACGASVISRNFVLTAGHCIPKRYSVRNFVVMLGLHDRVQRFNDSVVKSHSVRKIIKHPMYEVLDGDILINDLALLQLDRRIEFNSRIQPICLPNIDLSRFRAGKIQGWGNTQNNGVSARRPKEAILAVLTPQQCRRSPVYPYLKHVPKIDKMLLCAYERRADSCQGDSGGPLFLTNEKGIVYQIGIVSFGAECANSDGLPGLYTRLASYVDWVKSTIGAAEVCYPAN